MNRQLKRVSTVTLLMFLALFVSTSLIQVVFADDLSADERNRRTLLDSFSAERGQILVEGEPIAESIPVDDEYEYLRVYNKPRTYAPVTGYFTLGQGTTGIESELNDVLTGSANEQFFDQVSGIVTGQDPKGASVELTLDAETQRVAYDALGDNAGAVVAYEPKTGKILAMVSKTSYDPNELAVHDTSEIRANYDRLLADENNPLINRAISGDLYFPGSTFKVVMAAAALEAGLTPETEFPNPGQLTLPGTSSVITNAEGGSCGGGENASIATALRLSCNIPFAQLGQQLGYDTIARQAEAFGFGRSIDVPMTATQSSFPQTESEAQLMLASFGQASVRVTPLQMALVSGAIANGGTIMQPTLVEQVIAPDLSIVRDFEPSVFSQAVSAETAATLTRMMVDDVTDGAASNARIDGVEVAGKTGTAENGEGEPYTLWFTGFAPANDPEVAVAVVVENGGGLGQSGFGNRVAAPIAKQVMEAVLNQ